MAAIAHAKMLIENGEWDAEATVVATCSFTTGSCSLSVYKLTAQGLDWGKRNLAKGYADANAMASQPNPPEYSTSLFEKV